MRLLNTSSFELSEFFDDQIPHYAILSHRWENEEVTFQDLQAGRGPTKAGWSKIMGCCARAKEDSWDYAWIDSCCIDKSSSAELSEAINSMYEWYRKAEVCYTYLSDVKSRDGFTKSIWFTRGWTLQELLAPDYVEFYTEDWTNIGTKSSLATVIEHVTGIRDLLNFKSACIAQKMSWASRRETTRIEDMAYCLLGLFDVNMPLLYGEGEKAFHRLQLELLAQSADESIFAWDDIPSGPSLLAPSVESFRFGNSIRRAHFDQDRKPYALTNQGLRLELILVPRSDLKLSRALPKSLEKVDFFAPLNCHDLYALQRASNRNLYDDIFPLSEPVIAVPLRKVIGAAGTKWERCGPLLLDHSPSEPSNLETQEIYNILEKSPPQKKLPKDLTVLGVYRKLDWSKSTLGPDDIYMLHPDPSDDVAFAYLRFVWQGIFFDRTYTKIITLKFWIHDVGFKLWFESCSESDFDPRSEEFPRVDDLQKADNCSGRSFSFILSDHLTDIKRLCIHSKKKMVAGRYTYYLEVSIEGGTEPQ